MRLFPGRELEGPAKGLELFIQRESWSDRRHLEQDPTWLAEVDRSKVAAIPDLRHLAAPLEQLIPQVDLLGIVGDGHRHVVNGPQTVDARRCDRVVCDVENPAWIVAVDRKPNSSGGLGHDFEPEHLPEQLERTRRRVHKQRGAVQAADRRFRGYPTPWPRRSAITTGRDQFTFQPGRIREPNRLFAKPRWKVGHDNLTTFQPGSPEIERSRRNRERRCIDLTRPLLPY